MRGKRRKGFSGDHLHWHRFEGGVAKPFIKTARTMLSNAWMKCSLTRPDYARHGKTQVCYAKLPSVLWETSLPLPLQKIFF